MSESNDAAPHTCPQCGAPAYLGFGVPARCVQHGCIFFDFKLWSEWVMLVDDTGDPDGFDIEDEPTEPRFSWLPPARPNTGSAWFSLDTWGSVLNCPRLPNEDDDDYRQRLRDSLAKPFGTNP